ncbi:MAG: hypothetical protein RLZZ314_931 [Bacteroidota bacterium]|jgi:hypothetical protein
MSKPSGTNYPKAYQSLIFYQYVILFVGDASERIGYSLHER